MSTLKKLNPQQTAKLNKLEEAVWHGWESNLKAADALYQIWKTELYQSSHEKFEDYVKDKFGKSVQWAYDTLNWWKVITIAGCEQDPLSMNATRPLKSVKEEDEKVVKKILTEAKKIAKTKTLANVTRRDVISAKEKVLPPTKKTKAKATKPLPTVVSVVGLLKTVDKSLRLKSAKKLTVKQKAALQTQMDKLEVLVASIKESLASGGVEVGGTSK
jgi:hypothetical protein